MSWGRACGYYRNPGVCVFWVTWVCVWGRFLECVQMAHILTLPKSDSGSRWVWSKPIGFSFGYRKKEEIWWGGKNKQEDRMTSVLLPNNTWTAVRGDSERSWSIFHKGPWDSGHKPCFSEAQPTKPNRAEKRAASLKLGEVFVVWGR